MNKRIRKKRERLLDVGGRHYRSLRVCRRALHESEIRARHVGYAVASVPAYWATTLQFKRRYRKRWIR